MNKDSDKKEGPGQIEPRQFYLDPDLLKGASLYPGSMGPGVINAGISPMLLAGSVENPTVNSWITAAINPTPKLTNAIQASLPSTGFAYKQSNGFIFDTEKNQAILTNNSVLPFLNNNQVKLLDEDYTKLSTAFPLVSESSEEKAVREQREETKRLAAELKKVESSGATKEEVNKKWEEFEKRQEEIAQDSSVPGILRKLPILLSDLARYNQVEAVDALKESLTLRDIHWICGFGHKILVINSLNRLKEILVEQARGTISKCREGHQSFLLISGTKILTVSMEDMSRGKVRGDFKKQLNRKVKK